MKEHVAPTALLYPELTDATATSVAADAQQFRLQRISELEGFLRSELEGRCRL